MPIVSVRLSAHLLDKINEFVEEGVSVNKADVIRKAIKKMIEEEAVKRVLRAHKEPRLQGNLDELAAAL